jgi:catechol 2,3-dioxygenase-like lactoylglutathione lyase family enzyme
MTVTGPDVVALQVRELRASPAFYTEGLGLRRAHAAPAGAIVVTTAPIPFAPREPAVDLDPAHADLVRHGMPAVTARSDGPFGRTEVM